MYTHKFSPCTFYESTVNVSLPLENIYISLLNKYTNFIFFDNKLGNSSLEFLYLKFNKEVSTKFFNFLNIYEFILFFKNINIDVPKCFHNISRNKQTLRQKTIFLK